MECSFCVDSGGPCGQKQNEHHGLAEDVDPNIYNNYIERVKRSLSCLLMQVLWRHQCKTETASSLVKSPCSVFKYKCMCVCIYVYMYIYPNI